MGMVEIEDPGPTVTDILELLQNIFRDPFFRQAIPLGADVDLPRSAWKGVDLKGQTVPDNLHSALLRRLSAVPPHDMQQLVTSIFGQCPSKFLAYCVFIWFALLRACSTFIPPSEELF